MVKKITKTDKERELLEKTCQSLINYLKLSDLFFGNNPVYEMNELDEKSEFYQLAKDLADEMQIDWKNMSHEDSNRIMLAMLDEHFSQVRENEDVKSVKVEVKVIKITKEDGADSEDTKG